MSEPLRIVHLGALARSGETLLLRTLAAHPRVHVVHDLHQINEAPDLALYRLLRVWPAATVPRWQVEQHVAPGRVSPQARVLLLKQGVFAPRQPAAGFALVRNPHAVFSSLWSYDALLAGQTPTAALNAHHWRTRRLPRLLIWAEAMVPGLVGRLRAETDPVRQFLLFWRARTQQLLAHFPTVVRYEQFVQAPEAEVRRLCAALALPFDAGLLRAHEAHRPGQRGHGGIDLGAPIRPARAWTPTPLVPLEPFVAEVDEGPVALYRGLYREPVVDNAEPRRQAQLLQRLQDAQRGLRDVLRPLDAVRAQLRALHQADPLALALELSLLVKTDGDSHQRMRALIQAEGLERQDDALALALEALDPQDRRAQVAVARLLDHLPPLAAGKLFRHPAMPRNGALLQAVGRHALDDDAPLSLTPEGWFNLLALGYAIYPAPLFERLLRRLQAGVGTGVLSTRMQAIAARLLTAMSTSPTPPVAHRRLRVALCLSGQLRGWRHASATWHHLGLQDHDVDVYLHTWQDVGRRLPDPGIMPSVPRVFDHAGFCEAWIALGRRHAFEALQSAYPTLFAEVVRHQRVDADALRAAFGAGAVIVAEDESDPRFAGWSNQDKMHYKIWAADRLAADSGRAYDLVVRLRPDKTLLGHERLPDWAALAADSRARRTLFCEEPLGVREGLVMGDQFAAGAPEVVSAYAAAWTLTTQARAEGWHGFPMQFTGHASLAFTCLWQGLRPQKLPGVAFGPIAEDQRLTGPEIAGLLAADMPDGPRHDMDRSLLAALAPAPTCSQGAPA